MKHLVILTLALALTGCATSSPHSEITTISNGCTFGAYSITYAELDKGTATTLLCNKE